MKKSFDCLVVTFGLILFSVSVGAEEGLKQRIKVLEGKVETLESDQRKAPSETIGLFGGLKLSGFVDTSYVYDDNAESNTFSLDQFEVDIEKTISDKASLRADVNFNKSDEEDGLDFDEIMEQGYVTYSASMGDGVDFTFGKFNAPIGFELLDAPNMFQFSHALVFDFALPTNLTGVMATFDLGGEDDVNVTLYGVNGWDVSSDNNTGKTFGGRVGFSSIDDVQFGISALYGPELEDNESDKRLVVDVDLTITAGDDLTIGAEVNYGKEDNTSLKTAGYDSEWFGGLLMCHYDFDENVGLTMRYDYFSDHEGSIFGLVGGKEITRQAFTIAPTFSIDPGAGFLMEYRYDLADEDFFMDADDHPKDHNHTVAFEFTYSF